ncbi:MAG: Zinc-finger domain [Alphaproteobacteria bacterium]|jgi:uncharacterized Zn-finger protein|nr:Zinc-finger domain [Alphaproteobacteria bacterium]
MMARSASIGQVQDIIQVATSVVACDGRSPEAHLEDHLGHPLVYLAMEEVGHVICPYCSRYFMLIEQSDY